LAEPAAQSPLEVALFSDFGTGLYPALYIAAQLRQRKFPYAVHLGDVYYAGRKSEFQENFETPLNPILEDTRFFMLNANHEMLAGGYAYFDYIDAKKAAHPHTQEQEGSYFCLRSSRFQLIGIDTDYHVRNRLQEPELVAWLGQVLREGKHEGRTNILLSSNEPYKYGHMELKPLLTEDLSAFVREQLIDLWFWGNTHYCALFDAGQHTPFLGSCIGHGGYPYSKISSGRSSPAPARFVETLARFPAWTELVQDRGNNGYCVLRLKADGSIDLSYVDWMGSIRCEATLSKAHQQDRLTVARVDLHER
jgi:Calcineurin-like phosphoesterase